MRHVLHLMKPAKPGGRGGDEGGPTGQDETGRRVAPGDTPQHGSELNQAPVDDIALDSAPFPTGLSGAPQCRLSS
jgi:hypothetical protein